MGSTYLSDFACPSPQFHKSQSESFDWLISAYKRYQKQQTHEESAYLKLLQRVGVSEKQIAQRGYFLPDFHQSESEAQIFSAEQKGMKSRQTYFQNATQGVINELYDERKIPDHLIHITCTGYLAPSPVQILAAQRSPETLVTHSYHMGCYGAFPALRMASGFLHSSQLRPQQEVDLIHTELCTLHLDPEDPTLDRMLVQTLFADGVAAYRVSSKKPQLGFEILSLDEYLVPNTVDAMTWNLSERGFEMTLSKDVPNLIVEKLQECLQKWQKSSPHFELSQLKTSWMAVHPGGPKILDFVRDRLELTEDQIQFSRKVLREKGNMSSATLPHIWDEMLKDENVKNGELVVSMAFGPGLTLCLGLFRMVR